MVINNTNKGNWNFTNYQKNYFQVHNFVEVHSCLVAI